MFGLFGKKLKTKNEFTEYFANQIKERDIGVPEIMEELQVKVTFPRTHPSEGYVAFLSTSYNEYLSSKNLDAVVDHQIKIIVTRELIANNADNKKIYAVVKPKSYLDDVKENQIKLGMPNQV